MKSKIDKEKTLEALYDSIIDFQLLGLVPITNLMTYLDSPGIFKFFGERYVKFHKLGYYNFDEAERYNDKVRMKFIKWLNITLVDFLKLIDEFREIEKRVYDFLSKNLKDDILYDEIDGLICEMQFVLIKIKEHCIQVVDNKLQVIRENLQETVLDIKNFTEFITFCCKDEVINQEFLISVIELYPEILKTNIEDIKQYLSEDFYFNDENENIKLIERKMEELE